MEALYLIIGILLGGGTVYWLQRETIAYLKEQVTILTDLYNARLGYRKPKDDVSVAPPVETPPDTSRLYPDNDFPDLFQRQADAMARTEAETLKWAEAERNLMENA